MDHLTYGWKALYFLPNQNTVTIRYKDQFSSFFDNFPSNVIKVSH